MRCKSSTLHTAKVVRDVVLMLFLWSCSLPLAQSAEATLSPQPEQAERLWLIPPFGGESALRDVPEKPAFAPAVRHEKAPGALRLYAPVDEEFLQENYALRIKVDPEQPIKVFINGRPLDVDPLRTRKGDYYRVHGHRLGVGENILEVRSARLRSRPSLWSIVMRTCTLRRPLATRSP